MALHKNIGIADNHAPLGLGPFANNSARLSATVVAEDIGKFAFQTDNDTVWILLNNSPLNWKLITPDNAITKTYCKKATAGTIVAGQVVYAVEGPIVDAYHGKITFEDVLVDANGLGFRVEVKVNGEVQTERDPHFAVAQENEDFTIEYATGLIAFIVPLLETDVVTVSYHKVQNSVFYVKPSEGKKLTVIKVEVQFAENIDLKDSITYTTLGLADIFAPAEYIPSVFASGSVIDLSLLDPKLKLVYKTFDNYLDESNGCYPYIPAIGGSSWRGTGSGRYTLPWDYVGASELYSSREMAIQCQLGHNVQLGGDRATVTFYCTTEDE